jgi:peptide/nickel transport system permease protein
MLKSVASFVVIVLTTYLGLLAVTFFIGRVVPIDPVLAIVGDRAPAHVVERVRQEMGLNLPYYQQFILYVKGVLHGDFGTSVLTTNPVMTDIRRVFPATMELATVGTIIGAAFGIPLGVLAAVRRGSLADQIVRIIGLIGYSDLLARPAGAAGVLRKTRLDFRTRPHRCRVRIYVHAHNRLLSHRCGHQP